MSLHAIVFDFRKPVAYDVAAKQRFQFAARLRLRLVADSLGLAVGTFDLRSNIGGVAISGEVTLHDDRFYVRVCQSVLGDENGILFRACSGRRDHVGGPNHFAPLDLLNDPEALARLIRRTLHV